MYVSILIVFSCSIFLRSNTILCSHLYVAGSCTLPQWSLYQAWLIRTIGIGEIFSRLPDHHRLQPTRGSGRACIVMHVTSLLVAGPSPVDISRDLHRPALSRKVAVGAVDVSLGQLLIQTLIYSSKPARTSAL